jgi:hypothetical protein
MTTLIEQLMAEVEATRNAKEEVRAAEFRADQAEYEVYTRAKYTAAEKQDALAAGHAMANANGDPSYPIKDKEDLTRAIAAVGRGNADHDDIRKHIIKRATALGLASMIPDNWDMVTGELKTTTTTTGSSTETENRVDNADAQVACPTCDGKGTIMAGNRKCPDCGGDGKVAADAVESKSSTVPVTTWIGEATAEVTRNVNHVPDYRAAPEDADDRVNAHREQQVIAEILSLPDEQREEMITNAPDPDEIRAALNTYNDIENAVEDALSAAFGKDGEYCDIWVCDAGEDGDDHWAVFTSYVDPPGNGSFKVTYDLEDDGSISFTSNPVAVARVTTFEPIPVPKAPDLTADVAVAAARDADMIALERERDMDAEIRAIDDVPAKRSTKRSK